MPSNIYPSRIFYGWWIVVACLVITLYTGGIVHFGFTAVFNPIAEEFGWSYAQISLASSLRGLEMGILAPLMGFLVDRWGPRRLIFSGSITICFGFLILSQISSLAMFYVAFIFLATGMSTCAGTVMMTAVTNWFHRKAGLTIGIVSSGFALGGLMVPVMTMLIDNFEWRTAMIIVGIGMLVIVLPLSLLVRHRPEQYGYQPDGRTVDTPEPVVIQRTPTVKITNVSTKQALRSRAFWQVAISSMCHSFVVGAVITLMMPYLGNLGISRSVSSMVALVLPVASIIGRLGSGWLSGVIGSRKLYAVSFLLMTVGLFIFGNVTAGKMWLIILFVTLFSLGWGLSVTTRTILIREYFGRASFGTILGFTSGMMMLGNVGGAPLAGFIFDTFGTFKFAWFGYGILTVLGVILSLTSPLPHNTFKQ
ncbi:MFS transporter [Chloroflexota bacterium]